jgi:hypothetical protein
MPRYITHSHTLFVFIGILSCLHNTFPSFTSTAFGGTYQAATDSAYKQAAPPARASCATGDAQVLVRPEEQRSGSLQVSQQLLTTSSSQPTSQRMCRAKRSSAPTRTLGQHHSIATLVVRAPMCPWPASSVTEPIRGQLA